MTDDYKAMIEGALSKAQEKITDDIVQSIKSTAEWEAKKAIQIEVGKIVNAFIAEEVAPALRETLTGQRGAIIEGAVIAAKNLSEEIASAIVTQAMSNLAGYKRGEIIKALFDK